MKEFFHSLKPISQFSYFCLGFIVGERLSSFGDWKLFFIVGSVGVLSFILFQLWSKKIFYLFLGFSISVLVYVNLQTYVYEPHFLSQEDWNEFLKQPEILELKPIKEIKKNFFLFEICTKTKGVQAVFYHSSKIGKSEEYQCLPKEISVVEPEENPFFSFLKYYKNIYLRINVKNCQRKEISDLRFEIRKKIELSLEKGGLVGESKGIALGLLLGDSSYLSFGLKNRARESGILHIFAASGLHIGILVGFVHTLCSFIKVLPRYLIKLIPLGISLVYLWILSFPVSLTRAFFFLFCISFASLLYRKIPKMDLLLVSAFCILLLNREEFLSISFLLSFGAVAGILFTKNIFDKLIFGEIKGWFVDLITISLSASVGTFPILVYYFKSYSFGSIFINLMIVTLTGLLLPFLYLGLAFEMSSLSFIADYFWFYSEFQLRLLKYLAEETSFLGFYKKFYDNFYLLLLFTIWFLCIILIYEMILNTQRKEVKSKFQIYILRMISILIICSLFGGGFYIANMQYKNLEQNFKDGFFLHNSSFAVKKENSLYISGECFYHNYKMKQWIFSHNVQEVWIEKESCLFYGVYFYENQKAEVKAIFPKTEFSSLFPYINYINSRFPKHFQIGTQNIIFFSPETDKLSSLTSFTKTGSGKICLVLSKFSRDSLQDWKNLSKYLGVSQNYEISDCKEENYKLSQNETQNKNRIVF